MCLTVGVSNLWCLHEYKTGEEKGEGRREGEGGEERKRMKLAGTPCFFKYQNLKQTELRETAELAGSGSKIFCVLNL